MGVHSGVWWRKYVAVCAVFMLCSCVVDEEGNDGRDIPVLPSGTLYVGSTMEASSGADDRYDHPTEVWVGELIDSGGTMTSVSDIDGIFSPTLHSQVRELASYLDMVPVGMNGATVAIRGPLSESVTESVFLNHVSGGLYVDERSALEILPGETYELTVEAGGDRRYRAYAEVPNLPDWQVPDTFYVITNLEYRGDTCIEKSAVWEEAPLLPAPSFFAMEGLAVHQVNYPDDWSVLKVSVGGLRYEDRGDYRREGGNYGLLTPTAYSGQPPRLGVVWNGEPTDSTRDAKRLRMRWSMLDKSLSTNYWPEIVPFVVPPTDPYAEFELARRDAIFVDRDPQFFFDRSNLMKVGPDGELAPATDAVGVFGSYASVYRSTVLVPERSFDPDTLDCL